MGTGLEQSHQWLVELTLNKEVLVNMINLTKTATIQPILFSLLFVWDQYKHSFVQMPDTQYVIRAVWVKTAKIKQTKLVHWLVMNPTT